MNRWHYSIGHPSSGWYWYCLKLWHATIGSTSSPGLYPMVKTQWSAKTKKALEVAIVLKWKITGRLRTACATVSGPLLAPPSEAQATRERETCGKYWELIGHRLRNPTCQPWHRGDMWDSFWERFNLTILFRPGMLLIEGYVLGQSLGRGRTLLADVLSSFSYKHVCFI